jgi:uncharacterized protein
MSNGRRLAFVTGASSGIGATFARHLAADGYDLVLIARRADRLRELAGELGSRYGIQAETVAADLTRDEDVSHIASLLAASPELALLVNNAGFGTRGYLFEADAAAQLDMHRLHVLATLRLTQAALRGMVERDRGAIINVSSVAGFIQGPGNISYCATKTWMNSFTEGLAMELASLRSAVVVQALCPGYTYSEFHDVMGADRGEIPGSLWMHADFVVAQSLRGLRQRRLFVIPGWRYRALVRIIALTPRSLLQAAARRMRKPRSLHAR